ncbi:MAG TPA: serine/threonine-protein kinase [Polyangiaceae bacterium]|nr:serine/threonine-protein kinase [Polyangiaceae bacterium]
MAAGATTDDLAAHRGEKKLQTAGPSPDARRCGTKEDWMASIDLGSVLGGKFKVIRRIGAGGMGSVYEVEHTITKHRRALKLLSEEMAAIPAIVTRFLREASAAGRIGNPHVVETFDAGVLESGEPYIIMELLEGQTLADYISERGSLGVAETCDLLIQACEGIDAAHAAGIIHRDLKPENLFLVGRDKPFVKILDFGISKFDPERTGASNMTVDGATMGTPYYMPPEQARGEKNLDAQADVYALGVVLYECLCGSKPFVAETLPHLAILIAEGRYEPVSVRRPGLEAQCDAIIARAMVADRSQRYKSVNDLKAALETLRRRAGAEAPMTLPFAGTIPVQMPAPGAIAAARSPAAAPAATSGGGPGTSPAMTDAPLSHTRPEAETKRKSSGFVGAALGVLALAGIGAALLARGSGHATDPTGEAPSSNGAHAAAPSVVPVTAAPVVEPTLLPTATATASAAPSASATAATNSAPKTEKAKLKTRAAEHGLSEQNPF